MSTETSHLRWAVEAFPDLSFSAHRLIAEKLTKIQRSVESDRTTIEQWESAIQSIRMERCAG